MLYSNWGEAGGVAARPRQAVDEARANRIGRVDEDHRQGAGRLQQRPSNGAAGRQDDVGCERDHLRDVLADRFGIALRSNGTSMLTLRPSLQPQLLQPLADRRNPP